jgi:hypothetical protein
LPDPASEPTFILSEVKACLDISVGTTALAWLAGMAVMKMQTFFSNESFSAQDSLTNPVQNGGKSVMKPKGQRGT